MKYKTTLKFTVLLLLPLLMWGCFEDHASQFHLDDINQVEWAPPDRSSSSLTYTANLEEDQTESKTVAFTAQLIGAQTGSDRSVGVEVSETDADEGVHFELLDDEIVIPGNSSSGEAEVRILAENIENGGSYSVTLELQEGSELGVAVNMKDLLLTIEKDSE